MSGQHPPDAAEARRVAPGAFWGAGGPPPPSGGQDRDPAAPPTLPEPAWWRGVPPLTVLLAEVYREVGLRAAAALTAVRVEGDLEGGGEPRAEPPPSDAPPPPAAPASSPAVLAAGPEAVAPGGGDPDDAPTLPAPSVREGPAPEAGGAEGASAAARPGPARPQPLALPGLEGLVAAAAARRGRRRW